MKFSTYDNNQSKFCFLRRFINQFNQLINLDKSNCVFTAVIHFSAENGNSENYSKTRSPQWGKS